MDAVRKQRQAEDAAATSTLGASTRWLGLARDVVTMIPTCKPLDIPDLEV